MVSAVETKNVYNKRNKSTSDIEGTYKHLADGRESAAHKADKTIDADNVKLGVDEKYHLEIRKVLRKNNYLCLDWLGIVNIS